MQGEGPGRLRQRQLASRFSRSRRAPWRNWITRYRILQPERNRALTRNTLSSDQAEAIRAWLSEHWPDVERQRLSRGSAAGLCAASVGFRVTAANLANACRQIGKTWPKEPTADQRLGYRLHTLKRALAHVYRSLGLIPPSEDVARLLQLPWPVEAATSQPNPEEADR